MAAAKKKISVDTAVVSDLSLLDGIFTLKERKNRAEGYRQLTVIFYSHLKNHLINSSQTQHCLKT